MNNTKTVVIKLFTFMLAGVILGCSHFSSSSGKNFSLRATEEKTLPNGFKILYIVDNSLPRVGLQLMLNSGTTQDARDEEGLASYMMSVLDQGNKSKNALQIADAFAELGSSLGKSAGPDFMMVSTAGLSKTKDELLKLFSEVVQSPSFSNAEVERKRQQILADIAQMQDQPTEYASLLFDKEVFSAHPYGMSGIGQVKTISAISRTQIIKSYYFHFRPQNAVLAVTGSFDQDFKNKVEAEFAGWGARNADTQKFAWPQDSDQPAQVLVTKPGLKQAQIRFGHLSIPRNHPDFLKARLANLILGGAFASRLNQKIRDDLGLTYSIHSGIDAKADGGGFEISTFSRQEKVAEVIRNTKMVYENFVLGGITGKELDAAKALLVGQFPAAIETVDRLAMNMLMLRRFGVSDDYLKNFFNEVDKIELSEVNAVIKQQFRPKNLRVFVFADATQVQKQMEEIGPTQVRKVE